MKIKIGTINLYYDTESNLTVERQYISPASIKKTFTQDQIAEGQLGTVMALLREFDVIYLEYNDRAKAIIREC